MVIQAASRSPSVSSPVCQTEDMAKDKMHSGRVRKPLDLEKGKRPDDNGDANASEGASKAKARGLVFSFLAMIVVGLGNKIFQKLQTLPMHNYPLFLTLTSTLVYIPMSFAYIFPAMIMKPDLLEDSIAIPKHKFAVMGILDGIAGVLQTFGTNFVESGSLIILLTQAAIPVSMVISKVLLGARYTKMQYMGALVVVAGLIAVLAPSFQGGASSQQGPYHSQLVWAAVLVVSCIPMCLSSVYKEKALGETEIDVVYLNGWVSIFQFLVTIPLAVPSAWSSNMTAAELPKNLMDGWKCYIGINSVLHDTPELSADNCDASFVFVSAYICFNIVYNVLIILILKYGSANILYLALTIMVPLGNVGFSLDFMPGHKPLKTTDIVGLVVIMSGLCLYRFADKVYERFVKRERSVSFMEDDDDTKISHHAAAYFGVNAAEVMQPLLQSYIQKAHHRLWRSPQQIRHSYLSRLGFTPSPSSTSMEERRRLLASPGARSSTGSPGVVQVNKSYRGSKGHRGGIERTMSLTGRGSDGGQTTSSRSTKT